jgi:ABC-type lipoprotein release transport system permease subunit
VAVGLLVVLSLGHLMLVAVGRRRHDFAVLRAVGASRGWLTSVVHWQATAITAVVLGISVPLGSLAGASLYRRYVDHLGARPSSILPLGQMGLVLAALLVLANGVAAVAARRVRRDVPSTTLAAG